ncbi:MAG TPA: hypothetical protein VF865_14665 [Acidobacteriaceae bacterium]
MRKTYALVAGIALPILVLAIPFEPTVVKAFSSQSQAPLHPSTNPSAEQETKDWIEYEWLGFSFKYPNDWQVAPQYYRTPPEEAAGEPASVVGLTLSPRGEPANSSRSIGLAGRQIDCINLRPRCQCFSIYTEIYTCGPDAQTAKVFDVLLKTIKNNDSHSSFPIVFPVAQDTLHPGTRYTIRWTTKSHLRIPKLDIMVYDTSRFWREGTVLDVKGVPNTGSYDWIVPGSVPSPGPYLLDISFVKSVRATPPALSSGRIYEGRSNPFYIR